MNSADKAFLAGLQREVYANAVGKGWWDVPVDVGTSIALMHSELSEALEEFRNGRLNIRIAKSGKPEGLPVELADAVLRILGFCERHGIDLASAMAVKMAYNQTRPYRHGGKAI